MSLTCSFIMRGSERPSFAEACVNACWNRATRHFGDDFQMVTAWVEREHIGDVVRIMFEPVGAQQ